MSLGFTPPALGLWPALSGHTACTAPAGLMIFWRHLAGPEFPTLQHYLQPTNELSLSYPCLEERGCGYGHRLVRLPDGRIFSRSDQKIHSCRGTFVTEADLLLYELSLDRFGAELCRVLGFEPAPRALPSEAARSLWRIGTLPATRSPVYLTLCTDADDFRFTIQGLEVLCPEPYIILTPATVEPSEFITATLHRHRSLVLPLTPLLAVAGTGFRLLTPVAPLLQRFSAGCLPCPMPPEASAEDTPDGSGTHGRLRFANDFADLWLGEEHFDLRERNKARISIKYLYENRAFTPKTARHFERQINPYVRKHTKLDPLPRNAETKFRHYFNPSHSKYARLARSLIQSAGRGTGRYYLKLQ